MRWGFDKSPKVYVTFKQLRSLIATSGADVYGTGIFQLQMMSVSVHNGADIYITLECERLKLNASGGSDIKVSGKAKSLNANIASGSDLNAADFKVDNCDINVSGGSDAIVNVSVSILRRRQRRKRHWLYRLPKNQRTQRIGRLRHLPKVTEYPCHAKCNVRQ
jgi:hypothetical protein